MGGGKKNRSDVGEGGKRAVRERSDEGVAKGKGCGREREKKRKERRKLRFRDMRFREIYAPARD